jgi:Family of unknown function (DUF5819)
MEQSTKTSGDHPPRGSSDAHRADEGPVGGSGRAQAETRTHGSGMSPPQKSGAAGGNRQAGERSNLPASHGGLFGAASHALHLEEPDSTVRTRSTSSLVVLMATAVVLLGAVLWHLAMVFLILAPENSVTNRYQRPIDGYIYPEFGQNWQMFAPNPLAQNVAIGARVQTAGDGDIRHTWEWVNLSAPQIEAMRHNPIPSHLDQDMLRRAWDFYVDSHNLKDRNTNGMRGSLSTEYLARIALQHFGREWNGERIVSVQLASRTNVVNPPKWTRQTVPDTTSYRVLPWWPAKEKYYKEL